MAARDAVPLIAIDRHGDGVDDALPLATQERSGFEDALSGLAVG
jgi:hypothetical protein